MLEIRKLGYSTINVHYFFFFNKYQKFFLITVLYTRSYQRGRVIKMLYLKYKVHVFRFLENRKLTYSKVDSLY